MAKQATIELKNLTKEYVTHEGTGTFLAVDHINMVIESGQFVTLLGPSGCGKTTTLRMLAGFESVSEGDILLNGERINDMTPDRRDSSMVFQSYALFPHYDVFDNVGYGLVNKKLAKTVLREKVMAMLDLVGLKGLEHRLPNQLSGGQQQRVALARALVMEPAVLLFDEPLSNLDAKLRVYMRQEIRKIQQRIGITSIYVTHDQSEAMSLSDKIIIMNAGKIEQIGTPAEIYRHPVSHFVADFIGSANFVPGTVKEVGGEGKSAANAGSWSLVSEDMLSEEKEVAVIQMLGQDFAVPCSKGQFKPGDTVEVVIRPEAITLADTGDVPAVVTSSTYMGQTQDYVVQAGECELTTETYNPAGKKVYSPGDAVFLKIQWESLHVIKP